MSDISSLGDVREKELYSFTEDQLGTISVPVPPLKEQYAIATFLDEKCGEISKVEADDE